MSVSFIRFVLLPWHYSNSSHVSLLLNIQLFLIGISLLIVLQRKVKGQSQVMCILLKDTSTVGTHANMEVLDPDPLLNQSPNAIEHCVIPLFTFTRLINLHLQLRSSIVNVHFRVLLIFNFLSQIQYTLHTFTCEINERRGCGC